MIYYDDYKFIDNESKGTKVTSPVSMSGSLNTVSKPNSINAPEIKKGNGDELVITTDGSVKPKKYDLKKLEQTVQVLCAENNIDPVLLRKCLKEIAGKSSEDFANATDEEKAACLAFVQHSILRAKAYKAKYNKDVDLLKAVVLDAKFTHDAVTNGIFTDVEDMKAKSKEYGVDTTQNELLDGDLNSLSKDEIRTRVRNARKQMHAAMQANIAKIKNDNSLTEEEKIAKINKYETEMSFYTDALFNSILMKANSEQTMHALTLGGADKIGDYAERLMDTRVNDDERVSVANKMDYNFYEEDILKELYEQGEVIHREALSKYNSTVVSWKDSKSAFAYQDEYRKARERYQRGETPEYYTEDVFKATAEGIGFGARINHVMTPEDKAAFSAYWEKDALKFGDTDVIDSVNQKVEAYKQEHPAEANDIDKAKEIQDIITGKKKPNQANTKFDSEKRITFGRTNGATAKSGQGEKVSYTNSDKIIKDIYSGKITVSKACAFYKAEAVIAILKDAKLSKEFLKDSNLIAIYQGTIEQYVKTNLHKTGDKVNFVIDNLKTLHIVISCLKEEEKKVFANAIKGKLSYTLVKANCEEV